MLEEGRGPERRRRWRDELRHRQRDKVAGGADQDLAAVVPLLVIAGRLVAAFGRCAGIEGVGARQMLDLRRHRGVATVLARTRLTLGDGREAEAAKHERENSREEPAGHADRILTAS